MCFVQGTGEASIPLPLHPPFPPSFYLSVSPSLLPSLHLLHCTSSCPALRLPALCLLCSPCLMQEKVLPTPHATGSTSLGEWGWLSCCHFHQNSFPAPQHTAHDLLALTHPLSSWHMPSSSPFCLVKQLPRPVSWTVMPPL